MAYRIAPSDVKYQLEREEDNGTVITIPSHMVALFNDIMKKTTSPMIIIIKFIRAHFNIGLKDAKEIYDDLVKEFK